MTPALPTDLPFTYSRSVPATGSWTPVSCAHSPTSGTPPRTTESPRVNDQAPSCVPSPNAAASPPWLSAVMSAVRESGRTQALTAKALDGSVARAPVVRYAAAVPSSSAAPVTAVREGPSAPNPTPSPAVAGRPPASAAASVDPAASASRHAATGVRPSLTRNRYS